MITIESERDKYQRIWEFKDYRRNSPGEELIETFRKHVPYKEGESIIDLGCGPGRAAARLSQLGLKVTCLDIAENCLDEAHKGTMPFIQACLWDDSALDTFSDWFFCTDVMEHIPTEYVDLVLENIWSIADGGLFQIAMFHDGYGKLLINDTLHLTVKPSGWWLEKLRARWDQVKVISDDGGRMVVVVQ